MPYSLGKKSIAELQGVHPRLVEVVSRAIQITTQDFSVHDGLRTEAEQRELVRRKASKTMNSMHRKQADGWGHAVDLVPWIGGALRWEWGPIYDIAAAVKAAADELGVELVWGGVWDKNLSELAGGPASLKAAVVAYTHRHPGPDFIDGPHYQLAR